MVGSSKILTVSYGTFSCTLEGFDDSFDTMKAIAEYFRDLAADDRYFGAEPPTPDAEMLARIAEREISRRVEASEQQGRIVLRADNAPRSGEAATEDAAPPQEKAAPTALAAPQPETTTQDAPDADLADTASEVAMAATNYAPEPVAEPAKAAEPEWQEVPQPERRAPLAADPDSFAAKLHLIRSVVSGDAPSVTDQYSEDEHAQDFVHSDSDETAFWPDVYEDEVTEEEIATPADLAAHSEPEAAQQDAFEDTLAALLADDRAEPESPVEPAPQETDKDDAMQDEAPESPPVMGAEDGAAARDHDAIGVDEVEDDTVADADGPEVAEAEAAEGDAVAEADDIVTTDETAPGQDAVIEDEPLTGGATLRDAGSENDAPESLYEDETPELPSARVLKVKREALDEMLEQGLFEDDTDTGEAERDLSENMFDDESALSPEEEAELQRELAELEAEFDPEAALEDEPEEGEPETAEVSLPQSEEPGLRVAEPADHTPAGRRKLARAEAEGDLSRIFDETDSQLEAPASSQRRNTIQHLRAALEATRAEKAAGSELKPDVDETPYRADLADVVRPRRPQVLPPSEARSARPVEARPAPLKLVAEQRVDTDRGPIRPRRVSAADIQTGAETAREGGFTAFAEKVGASALPDLLEAAAAYLADVEGRPQFSRPMLMGKLKEIEQDRFSREDGLRSFGKLLRDGKLQKLSGGRFAITEETEFRARNNRQAG
ncbi:pilus assembly protein FimV [Roseovarius sp. MBR-154]|jgi:hypothetical protein